MLPFHEHGPADARPVFLLLHFFGGSHREWEGVVDILKPMHRTVAADMAGFGEAAALEGFHVSAMAAKITELVGYVAPAPVIVVGHSMSGKAAMVAAAQPAPNFAGLVLVAPSPLAGEPMTDVARSEMRIANTARTRAEKFTRTGFAHTPPEDSFEAAVADVLRSSDDAFRAWADHGTREDWSSRVTALPVPSILVVGEQDKAIAPDLQRSETLPLVEATGGRMYLLPDTAHLVPYERPAELATILSDFARLVKNGRPDCAQRPVAV